MSKADIETVLNTFGLTKVYFGWEGFHVFAPEELPDGQLGYSRLEDGTDLTEEAAGDWKGTWTVISYDTSLGDPYFVDTGKRSLPVYTAMHGIGSWNPRLVSPALHNFLNSLNHLKARSNQTAQYPEVEEVTLTDGAEIKALEQEISRLNGEGDFWEEFFERYVDWLEENEDDDL